jgi:SEL1 protein
MVQRAKALLSRANAAGNKKSVLFADTHAVTQERRFLRSEAIRLLDAAATQEQNKEAQFMLAEAKFVSAKTGCIVAWLMCDVLFLS